MLYLGMRHVAGAADITNGLVAFYSFDGNGNDRSGNNLHGTINGATFTDGVNQAPNSAIDLDGTATIDVPHADLLSFTRLSPVTFSIWVQARTTDTQHVFGKRVSAGANYQLLLDGTGFRFHGDPFTGGIHDPSLPAPNTWIHLACTWDGTTCRLYRDGALVATENDADASPLGSESSLATLRIGRSGGFQAFNGKIDNFRIYRRALSAADVAALRAADLTPLPPVPEVDLAHGLVAHYPFDGDANDFSGNNLHGSAQGATLAVGVTGSANTAYDFDGAATIDVPHSPLLTFSPTNPVSFSIWAQARSTGAAHLFGKRDASSGAANYQLLFDSRGFTFHGNPFSGGIFDSNPPPPNAWVHLVCTWDGIESRIYRNGLPVVTNVGPAATPLGSETSTPLVIGGSATFQRFDGRLDNFRVYNRALSPNNVSELFALESGMAPTNRPVELAAYLPFSGSAEDLSGNGHHGVVDSAVLTPDRFGFTESAYDFSGGPASIQVSPAAGLNPAHFAVSVWAKPNVLDTAMGVISKQGLAGSGENGYFIHQRADNRFEFGIGVVGSALASVVSTNAADLMANHHLIGTYDGSELKFYVNGRLHGQTPVSTSITSPRPLQLGRRDDPVSPGSFQHFVGSLDDFRLYRKALSIAEVTSLHDLERVAPSLITQQPPDVSTSQGNAVTFVVQVRQGFPHVFQWYRNGSPINGATGSSLNIANAQPSDAANYSVLVYDGTLAERSRTATLAVNRPPSITAEPMETSAALGDAARFSVTVSGTGPFSYQWLLNGSPVAGATNSAYQLPDVQVSHIGAYSVRVTGPGGSVTSSAVPLTGSALHMYAGVTVAGQVGQTFRIDYANVVAGQTNWLNLTNVTLTNAAQIFVDLNSPGNAQRFYRVLRVAD